MLTVTKEFIFDAAHMLEGHEGLCKNLHGHTYKVLIEVCNRGKVIAEGPSEGMVIDFKHLKEEVNKVLFDKLDHAMIGWERSNGDESALLTRVDNLGMKIYWMPYRPTAENMCRHFSEVLKPVFAEHFTGIRLVSIIVYETPTSFAKIYCGGNLV